MKQQKFWLNVLKYISNMSSWKVISVDLCDFCSVPTFTSYWAIRLIFLLDAQYVFNTQLSFVIKLLSLLCCRHRVRVGNLADVLLIHPLLGCCTRLSAVKLLSVALRWVHGSGLAVLNWGSWCRKPLRAKIEVMEDIWLRSMLPDFSEFYSVSSWGWGEIGKEPCVPDIWIVAEDYRLGHRSESWLLTSELFIRGIASMSWFEDRVIFMLVYVGLEFLELDV